MKLKQIENIIDSVDPYHLVKDMGFKLISTEGEENDLYTLRLLDRSIRVMPNGYLNLDLFSNPQAQAFAAGTAIDLLAFYMRNNYEKAFKLFFTYYMPVLKTKLVHEPEYIARLVKATFIKRKNVLNFIISKLLTDQPGGLPQCGAWKSKYGIDNLKGFAYCDTSAGIFSALNFLVDNRSLEYDEAVTFEHADPSHPFSDFINNHLFKESKEWIVVPYFADYHIVNGLKLINPADNTYHYLPLNNAKLSFAGLYALPGSISFANDKIRIQESTTDAMVLHSHAKRTLNGDTLHYLALDMQGSGVAMRTNLGYVSKPIFLFQKDHSNFLTLKALKDSLTNRMGINEDLYVCNYANYKESPAVYTYDAFLEKEFQDIIEEIARTNSVKTRAKLGYLMEVCDFHNLPFKKHLLEWILSRKYTAIYQELVKVPEVTVSFKTYDITATTNGYICHPKSDVKDTQVLSNFILKIDQNIIFCGSDEILHKGRLIMGENFECPIQFYKKELKGRADALENVALRAFSMFNPVALDEFAVSHTLPVIFDKTYLNAIYTLINHEINQAPCKYGVTYPGWDDTKGVYNSIAWQASSMRFVQRPQTIYSMTEYSSRTSSTTKDIQNCFTTLKPPSKDWKKDLKFLNNNVKDLIGYLLAAMYRQYLGYNVKPLGILDSRYARNMMKFVFAAFGQNKPYEAPPNTRLMKSGRMFECLNGHPIYVRCKDPLQMLKCIDDYPYVIAVPQKRENEQHYAITTSSTAEGYATMTQFTMDTFSRFFKWLFDVQLEEFEVDNQICQSGEQMIEEGNIILKYLWWEDVLQACQTYVTPLHALQTLIGLLPHQLAMKNFLFYADRDLYVMRRMSLSSKVQDEMPGICDALSKSLKGGLLDNEYRNYFWIDKKLFEEAASVSKTKDGQNIDPEELQIFLTKTQAQAISSGFIKKRAIPRMELLNNHTLLRPMQI